MAFCEKNSESRWALLKILAVSQGGRDLFPTYALGDDGKPLPALKDVLGVFHGKRSDWAIATWFASDNGWLGGAVPARKLSSDPSSVLQAAKMEVEPSEHG